MPETEPIERARHIARRLGRLFKIERVGALDRRGYEIGQRVIARRAALLGELIRLDTRQRRSASPRSAALEQTLAELAQEVDVSLRVAQSRVQRLRNDLRLRLGEGRATGIRDNSNGRLLGKS